MPAGLVISAPGLQAVGPPPWPPEYAHLAARLKNSASRRAARRPSTTHALLHIYNNGLLEPPAPKSDSSPRRRSRRAAHTRPQGHHPHGVAHPYKYTLGDFFPVWGVKFGPAQVGSLTGDGGDKLHFFVNGRPLSNPAAYVSTTTTTS